MRVGNVNVTSGPYEMDLTRSGVRKGRRGTEMNNTEFSFILTVQRFSHWVNAVKSSLREVVKIFRSK